MEHTLTQSRLFYRKTAGQYHSAKGAIVETIGKLTGSSSWQRSGRREHEQGQAEYNHARTMGHAQGTTLTDRLGGMKNAGRGGLSRGGCTCALLLLVWLLTRRVGNARRRK